MGCEHNALKFIFKFFDRLPTEKIFFFPKSIFRIQKRTKINVQKAFWPRVLGIRTLYD
jgi:hypothetical protein